MRCFIGVVVAVVAIGAEHSLFLRAGEIDEANVVLTNGAPSSGLILLDNADPNYQGQPFYEDNLSCIGTGGQPAFRITGFNNCETIGSNRKIAIDPERKWIWTIENVAHRLRRFDLTGKQLIAVEDVKASALAVDPATGNVWVLTSNGRIPGEGTVVFSADGKRLAEYPVSGFDIAYDGKSKSFWIAGNRLTKITVANGQVVFEKPIAEWCASCIAVHQPSGKVWIAVRQHPDVAASKSELLAFNNDGTPAAVIPLPETHPFHVSIEEGSGAVWLTALRRSVMRFSSAGVLQAEHKIEALTAEVDRATGDVWVVTSKGVTRLGLTGRVVESIELPKPTSFAWVAPL